MSRDQPPETTLRQYADRSGWYVEAVGGDRVHANNGDFNSAEAIDGIVTTPIPVPLQHVRIRRKVECKT